MRGFHLIVVAGVLSGCSFLVSFDPETQPCDSLGGCQPGYACTGGLCRADDGGLTTPDSGAPDSGSSCAARETLCGDGKDDDCDNQTDCADSDCAGLGCNDGNSCTTGETCAAGACGRGNPVTCNAAPGPCYARAGTCVVATGLCLYPPLADGTLCATASASRCCAGACMDTTTSTANCGGCGLSCSIGQVCQSLNQSICGLEPIDTSGRCSCNATAPCPQGQTCAVGGFCTPATAQQCAPGQSVDTFGAPCTTYCRY